MGNMKATPLPRQDWSSSEDVSRLCDWLAEEGEERKGTRKEYNEEESVVEKPQVETPIKKSQERRIKSKARAELAARVGESSGHRE